VPCAGLVQEHQLTVQIRGREELALGQLGNLDC